MGLWITFKLMRDNVASTGCWHQTVTHVVLKKKADIVSTIYYFWIH